MNSKIFFTAHVLRLKRIFIILQRYVLIINNIFTRQNQPKILITHDEP